MRAHYIHQGCCQGSQSSSHGQVASHLCESAKLARWVWSSFSCTSQFATLHLQQGPERPPDRHRARAACTATWPVTAGTRKTCKPKLPKSHTDSGKHNYPSAICTVTNPDWFVSARSYSSTTVYFKKPHTGKQKCINGIQQPLTCMSNAAAQPRS